MLQEIDCEPLGAGALRESDSPKEEPPAPERDLTRALRVVDERSRKNRRGAEAERVPLLRASDHVGATFEEGSQDLVGRWRHRPEAARLRMDVQARCELLEHPLSNETMREARRVRAPPRELSRPV